METSGISLRRLRTFLEELGNKFAEKKHSHATSEITGLDTALDNKASKDHTHTASEVGLGNVGNFKAVSTVASQGLTDTEKANARANIGAGTSSFDGNYNNLTNKPTIPTVDSALSSTSANPVQNKVVNTALSGKANSSHKHDSGDINSLDASKLTGTIDIARLPQGALDRLVKVADDTARFKLTTNDIQLGDTVQTLDNKKMYYVVDESKLSSADGYAAYTADTATSVPWSGVTGKPSSYTPSSHTHDDRYYTETEMDTKLAGKSDTGHTHNQYLTAHQDISGKVNNDANGADSLLSKITTAWTATPTDDTNFIRQDTGGGNTFGRVKFSTLWSYIKGKADSVYAKVSHTHTKSQITDFPTSMAANGGNSTTVNGHTVNSDVPANAKFTDTNTWRGIQDNLTSTSTSDSLSANQGKVLKGLVDGKAASNHTHSYAGSSSAGGAANSADKLNNVFSGRQTSGDIDFTNSAYANKVTYTMATSSMTTGKPPSDGHLLSFGWDTTAGWGAQMNIGDGSGNHMHIRGADSKDNKCVYGNWKTVLDSTNYTDYAAAKSHSHSVITGKGKHTETASGTTANAPTAGLADTTKGIYMTENYNDSNTPSNYGNIINIVGSGTGQLMAGWSGTDSTTDRLHYRSHRDTSTGGWGSWKTVAYTSDIPSVGNGTVTITQNGTSKGTFTMNQSGNTTIALTDNNTTYGTGNASTAGLTKLYTGTGTATDGTMTQNAIKSALDGKASSSHTHNYAGSSSAGGAANSANKLATARNVSGGTDITMSFNYDGSGNSSASIGYYNSYMSIGNTNNYPYHRIAKLDTITGAYVDKTATLYITQDYNGGSFGICRISLRTNNSGQVSSVEAKWLVRSGFNANDIQIGLNNVYGSTYADVFLKSNGTYAGTVIRAIANGSRGSISRTWTLVNSSEANNTTSSNPQSSSEVYTSIEVAATKLHNKAYTNIVAGNDVGTTNYANSAGSVSWGNVSGKPSTYTPATTTYNVTVAASSWSGSSAPYSATISIAKATTSNVIEVAASSSATSAQITAMANAMICNGTQAAGSITIKAYGEKPTVALPLTVVVFG